MAEPIGNASTRVMAWAERIILSLNPQAEKVSRRPGTQTFIFKGEVSGPHQNLDTSTTEGLGLLAYELPHVIQQTHPQQLPHRRLANRDSGPTSVALTRSHPGARTILPAPAQNKTPTAKSQDREAQGWTREKLAAKVLPEKRPESTLHIHIGEVADRVYHLMRHDLILERERTTRLGG